MSYRHMLLEEFQNRKEKDRAYSIRSFSKQISLSPAFISLIFRGKRHLGYPAAVKMVKGLGWPAQKQKYFLSLLEFENPKTDLGREEAVDGIRKYMADANRFESLELDKFMVMSVWYHSAIFTFLATKKGLVSLKSVAKKFGLEEYETEVALNRMRKLSLVDTKNSKWFTQRDYLRVEGTPSEAIRAYHRQFLKLAEKALEEQKFTEREFSNLTIAVDPVQLPLVKKRIAEFQDELANLLEGTKSNEVYQMSFQLFRLSKAGEMK